MLPVISQQSLGRAIRCAATPGSSFKEGGDYLKNHEIRAFFLSILSFCTFGTYGRPNAEREIQQKTTTLSNATPGVAKTIIEAKEDNLGAYNFTISLGEDINGHQVDNSFGVNCTADKRLIISNDREGAPDTSENIDMQELKRAFLQEYINKQRDENPNQIVILDKATLNLEEVADFSGIDFKGVALDRENLQTIIAKKGSLVGATLIDDTSVEGLAFRDVKMDLEMLCLLVLLKADLRGVDLSNQNLEGLDKVSLAGVDLTDANFTNAKARSAVFNKAILTNTNFTGADIRKASFVNANLTGMITNSTDIKDAEGNRTSLPTNFTEADIRFATLGDAFNAVPLKSIVLDVEQVIKLGKNVSFSGANLFGKDKIVTNDFSGKSLVDFQLSDTNFYATNCKGTDFTNAIVTKANLSNVLMDEHTNVENADFSGSTFDNVDLSKVLIKDNTKISGILVNNAKLSRAWVEAAIKQNVKSLKGVNLEGVDLSGLDLSKIDLTGAKLKDAILFKMDGENIQRVKLNASGLKAALISREVKNEHNHRVSVDLKGIDLSGSVEKPTSFTETNFNHVDLSNSNLDHCCLDESKLEYCNLTDVSLANTSLKNIKQGFATVIVSDQDRKPYIEQLKNRINFIASGKKEGVDPFYSMPSSFRLQTYNSMFFHVSDITLKYGDTNSDQGNQKIVIDGKIDPRHINSSVSKDDIVEVTKHAADKLLGEDFTKEQKILFHWARSTTWAARTFNTYAVNFAPNNSQHADIAILQTEAEFRSDIYLRSEPEQRALSLEALNVCFDAALSKIQTDFPNVLTEHEINQVLDLFTSKNHTW